MPHVRHMQKGGAFQTDINERRLHTRQDTSHLAKIHITYQTPLQRALDVQFLEGAVFNNGHTRLLR